MNSCWKKKVRQTEIETELDQGRETRSPRPGQTDQVTYTRSPTPGQTDQVTYTRSDRLGE